MTLLYQKVFTTQLEKSKEATDCVNTSFKTCALCLLYRVYAVYLCYKIAAKNPDACVGDESRF